MWLRVSKMRSRVSPRAGGTDGLDGDEVVFSASYLLSVEVRLGVFVAGVPGLGDGEYARSFSPEAEAFPFKIWFDGGANRSIVNVKKSSCCNFKYLRIVLSMVEIVRNAPWRTRIFSERAS